MKEKNLIGKCKYTRNSESAILKAGMTIKYKKIAKSTVTISVRRYTKQKDLKYDVKNIRCKRIE